MKRIRLPWLVSTLLVVSLLSSAVTITRATSTITGNAFRDFNANGTQDASEAQGVGNVTVTAYDASNTVRGTATTALDGSYSLNATGSGPYRIEFTGWPSYLQPAAVGSSNGSSVQFIHDGNATVNVGLNDPAEFCQDNPELCTSQMWNGDNINPRAPTSALIKLKYNDFHAAANQPAVHTTIATKAQIGSTWGHAYARTSKTVYSAAFVKRHVGLGPNGPGAIYATDINGTSSTLFADLATLGANLGSVPSNSARGLGAPNAPNNDVSTYAQVGEVGLGGIALSTDEQTLYAISLNNRTMYALNIPGGTLAGSFPIADPGCIGGTWRPFAVKYWHDAVYVGGVCDAQASQNAADLHAYVLRFMPGPNTFTSVFNFALNYPKGNAGNSGCSGITGWYAWLDTYAPPCRTALGGFIYDYPQPVLSNIEFDVDGSMILGFFDRMGHQFGFLNYGLTGNTVSEVGTQIGGDTLRAYNNSGSYILENNATAGPATTAGAGNGQGPGRGEFYYQDNFATYHQETTEGSLALLPGKGEVVAATIDPFDFNSQGIAWFDNTTGAATRKYEVERTANNGGNGANPSSTGKSNGLGDLELLCDAAPIEIGNRVWNDADGNGVQDADEPPITGVTVQLLDSTGAVVATAVTDANGNYLFSNLASGTSSTSALYGLPIVPNTSYIVQVARLQPALTKLVPTTSTADTSTNGASRDSNGVTSGANVVARVTTGPAGANNHTIDFGFSSSLSLGDLVWEDTNGNGVQDGGEKGVSGVTVTLYDGAGNPLATTTTDTNGGYQFTDLLPGTYSVGFSNLPSGYTFTTRNLGGYAQDSDANPATGRTQPVTLQPGEPNPTLDAGIVIAPTAITLSQFKAIWREGKVLINWTTRLEIDTFGFRLLRSDDGTLAHAIHVMPAPILAQGRGQSGAVYSWRDAMVTSGHTYTYWLEEIELNGNTHDYGPATIRVSVAGTYTIFLPAIR